MMQRPNARRRPGRQPGYSRETRRWIVMVIVLIGSLAIYAVERWMRTPDAPVIGTALVVDGDSLVIDHTRIRLVGIDAPELDQTCLDAEGRDWPCGRQASAQLRSHIRNRPLTCPRQSLDQFGRVLATCTLPDGSSINAWMVAQGWAVSYDRAGLYDAEQAAAKVARRGIWAGSFVQPHEWRRQNPRRDDGRGD
jgi:endonuclease YncB( thermonuclease family)